ncbi:MAG TPA: metalloregulator ArsR/SmtB family transcription factor [Methanoregulaceae archaeon]|nr:metalloregulator ArsR/SmtB family transcription factor [Methanoregulaceae archaeon]HQJ88527.1 metalloregulator ArsR/SmtB family transcription factor [Methanoregulaceae archaeon]
MTVTQPDGAALRACTTLFKALSDETRLRIFLLLGTGELCVCQIQAALAMSQAKVSRHLMVLRHAGLVDARREGLWMYYSRRTPETPSGRTFTDRIVELLDADPELRPPVVSDPVDADLPFDGSARKAGDRGN